MDTKQPLSLFLVAILAFSVVTMVGLSSLRLVPANAQAVTIKTSGDAFGGTFFGESFLQVVITNPDADDDDTVETLSVDVDVTPETGSGGSATFDVPETSASSGKFEFYLVQEASNNIGAADLDPDATSTFVVSFGPTGTADAGLLANETITADVDPSDVDTNDASIDITAGDEDITVTYEQMDGELTLDRDTAYGSQARMHVFITDEDSNNDPTHADSFTVVAADLAGTTSDSLFKLTGGTLPDDVTFDETGDNTAKFEAVLQLNGSAHAGVDDELVTTSESMTLTLFDHADYRDVSDADGDVAEDSTSTDDESIEVDDVDGDIADISALTFGSELKPTITDTDRNVDSEIKDDIPGALIVDVDAGDSARDFEHINLEETGKNTGVFVPDLSNSELKVTFLADGEDPVQDDGILQLRQSDIDEDIFVAYQDPTDDDGLVSNTTSFKISLDIVPGTISAPAEVGVNDEFTATLTDPDLNDNPRTKDSYTIHMTGPLTDLPLQIGSDEFGEMYDISFELDGDALNFGAEDVSVTMTETGINTGVFEFDIDMKDIAEFGDSGDNLAIDDGSDLEIQIDDNMDNGSTDPDEDDVKVTIGKANVGVDFSRTSVPIPPEDNSLTDNAGIGTEVVVTMIVTDPSRANETGVKETFPIVFGDNPGQFHLEVDGDDVNHLNIESNADYTSEDIVDGVALSDVLDVTDTLEETGKATGIFESELVLTNGGMESNDWQDAEFTFTYFDTDGDDESGGFTVRGNDGVVTVDQPSAKAGTTITISVEDQDLNVDDGEIDTFESANADTADNAQLLLIETEDDEINSLPDTDTFRETGEDTGVFEASFVVGDDIAVTDNTAGDQATNILITYEDEIDSTGGNGDEIEANVPIVTGTGSIQVTPELAGPATELTVLIVDSDLDEDPDTIDDINAEDDLVTFASSRNEVNDANPDLEETGTNTGVFKFQLQLETDEQACQDDDLGDSEFEATGGDTDSTIGACPGDLISIKYDDELAADGRSTTVSAVVEVKSYDPEFKADKDSYNVNDRPTITISDPDANRDPDVADSLTDIRVFSDSDRVGDEFSALETGRDTGVFRLTFGISEGNQGGAISVRQGDDITIRYTDEFPADFEEQEEDKDFEFTVNVGGIKNQDATTVTAPALQDASGKPLTEVSAGQQVVITTNVLNKNSSPQPMVALIEVRNSDGQTVYLAWQTGTLNPNGQAQVGLSWTPATSGSYQLRTFVIDDLSTPAVLSQLQTSTITVS